MKCIIVSGQNITSIGRRWCEPVIAGEIPGHGMIIKTRCLAQSPGAQPVLMDIADIKRTAMRAKWVKVTLPNITPVNKFNPQLETRLRVPDEITFIYAECLIESEGRFLHNKTNLLSLNYQLGVWQSKALHPFYFHCK